MLRPILHSPIKSGLNFYLPSLDSGVELPYFLACVSAGFPSPAEDYQEKSFDLNKELITNTTATICVKVKGDSMQDALIFDGDVLVVDRSLKAGDGDIAVCVLDGEFTVKRLRLYKGKWYLKPENKSYPAILIQDFSNFRIWGVVSYIIHKAR